MTKDLDFELKEAELRYKILQQKKIRKQKEEEIMQINSNLKILEDNLKKHLDGGDE